jgi:hypothetical protein
MSKKSYVTYDEQAHEYEGQAKRLENVSALPSRESDAISHIWGRSNPVLTTSWMSSSIWLDSSKWQADFDS